MDRILDRAFNTVHGTVSAVVGSADAEQREKQQQRSKEDAIRSKPEPMTAADVVERISLAFKDGDYFRLLQLPGPQLNELGRAAWPVSSSELSKAFRRLSILVHPDKNPGPDAREAFEQLKQAYNELRDTDKLAARLREAEPGLVKAAERAAATASMAERVELNAAAEQRKAKLRQEQARSFQDEIREQMRRRQAEAGRKKQRAQSSRYSRQEEEEASPAAAAPRPKQAHHAPGADGGSSSDDNDDDYSQRHIKRKRKKPTFM